MQGVSLGHLAQPVVVVPSSLRQWWPNLQQQNPGTFHYPEGLEAAFPEASIHGGCF